MDKETKDVNKQIKDAVIELYTKSPVKALARGEIKKETLDKIMEKINANCDKKNRNWKHCKSSFTKI